MAIISKEEIVSRIDKNLIKEGPSFICVMHLPQGSYIYDVHIEGDGGGFL